MQKQTLDIKQEEKKVWDMLSEITDPEIPVLNLRDMGIIRHVAVNGNAVAVTITPTYSGCPAMDMITMQIKMELLAAGYEQVTVNTILSPAWSTDWMSEMGKAKLKAYGIAPPTVRTQVRNNDLFAPSEAVQCPRCNSYNTVLKSEFGSTACKSLYLCNECKEPFDYFKCH